MGQKADPEESESAWWVKRFCGKGLTYFLSLRLSARGFLNLGLVFAAGAGAGTLGGGLLAGSALELLALGLVSNFLGVCH